MLYQLSYASPKQPLLPNPYRHTAACKHPAASLDFTTSPHLGQTVRTPSPARPSKLKPAMRILSFLLLLTLPAAAQTPGPQQHTDGAPAVIEGPQTPGTQPAHASIADSALMDNDTVLRMHKAGLSDELILQTVTTQPGRYDTTPDALITLKSAGLDDALLAAMANKQRRQITGTPAGPIELSPVNDIGVYYKDKNGAWQPMESEVVHIKSGGFIKSTLTDGIIKKDQNGTVEGPTAKLVLSGATEFLVYTPEGVTASEYDLVQFRLHSNRREFRTNTGGIIHGEQSAKRDEVPFTPKRIAPRTWTFTLPQDIGGGEYGILPAAPANVVNAGKIFTFAITE